MTPDPLPFTDATTASVFIEGFATRPLDRVDALPPHERQAARFGEMTDFLALLGHPEVGLQVAHIAGTSGKGSTATILASLLRAAGVRVGLYSNPYLIRPQERIQIAGEPIADASYIAATTTVAAALMRYRAQFPERAPHLKQIWVAVALIAFAQANLDLVVVETGMGGRYDETNVVHPVVSIITTIDYDHQEFLGETLAEIAWQKAGIIKSGRRVISGVTTEPAAGVIQAEAHQKGAQLIVRDQDFSATTEQIEATGVTFTYCDERDNLPGLHLPLAGAHQARNAAVAIRAARALVISLHRATIQAGLDRVALPGRFEVVAHAPTIVLDIAHNPEKIRAFVATLHATLHWGRLHCVFGALGTKAISAMLALLAPDQPHIYATAPTVAGRRAIPAEEIATLAHDLGLTATAYEDPHAAITAALAAAMPGDVIAVTGSLFLVGQLRERWR